MPFVLRDYTSKELDLHASASFRDLSLPMGAQNEKRRKQFQDRFAQLSELQSIDPEATKPFHYGTHYSTAATVSGYLIRLRPFDKIVKALQGGAFDLPDRIFSSIGQAYLSASEGSLGDVRELIPEAFYLPEFLVNANVSVHEDVKFFPSRLYQEHKLTCFRVESRRISNLVRPRAASWSTTLACLHGPKVIRAFS